MTRDTKFPASDWRSGYFNPQNLANTLDRVDALKAILPAAMSLPEMALRFVLSHSAVSTTIIGMRKLDHVRENIALSDKGPLDPQLLQELKKHRWDRKPAPWSD
jgi:aryl-alcohol dehydrogenase-like predicted oxidoreductase